MEDDTNTDTNTNINALYEADPDTYTDSQNVTNSEIYSWLFSIRLRKVFEWFRLCRKIIFFRHQWEGNQTSFLLKTSITRDSRRKRESEMERERKAVVDLTGKKCFRIQRLVFAWIDSTIFANCLVRMFLYWTTYFNVARVGDCESWRWWCCCCCWLSWVTGAKYVVGGE